MRHSLAGDRGSENGATIVDTLTAIVVFVLLALMIDSVFISAHRSARAVEVAADVDQNARLAIERLTREIREASPAWVKPGGNPGVRAVVFKSARFSDSIPVFCLDVTGTSDSLYDPLGDGSGVNCWTGPPGPAATPGATYVPKWQRYIGYYVEPTTGGLYNLRRYTGDLTASDEALPPDPADPPIGSSDQVIATGLQSFDITLAGSRFTVVATRTEGTEIVQGSPVPTQRIQLEATVLLQN